MTEDVRMVAEKRSETFCADSGSLRDLVGEIIDFARSVPRDAMLHWNNNDFSIHVKFERPETVAERNDRLLSKRSAVSRAAEKEIAQMEYLMLKYKDIAKIKMRDIEECVNVK